MLKDEEWVVETMRIINSLTPNIEGKAFNPDWFLLRQRFENIARLAFSQEKSQNLSKD